MKQVRKIALIGTLSLLFALPATRADDPTTSTPAATSAKNSETQPTLKSSPIGFRGTKSPTITRKSNNSGDFSESQGSDDSKTGSGSNLPTGGTPISEEIRKMIEAANKARADFLKKQQELRSGLPSADKGTRDQIRSTLREQREAFLAQQQEAREDLKKELAKLKEQLKDHREAIDQAKETSKSTRHTRKGD